MLEIARFVVITVFVYDGEDILDQDAASNMDRHFSVLPDLRAGNGQLPGVLCGEREIPQAHAYQRPLFRKTQVAQKPVPAGPVEGGIHDDIPLSAVL